MNIGLNQTTKPVPQMNIAKNVDQYEVYESEYNAANQYRVCITVHPYCSNVLYNMITEILRHDIDTDRTYVMRDNSAINIPDEYKPLVYGKETGIYRHDMVTDTEYSKEGLDYEYRPGYDIFNNHSLRSLTFRTTNGTTAAESTNFNTIRDTLRDVNGTIVQFSPRTPGNELSMVDRHVYEHDNILTFSDGESFERNIKNENGWYGFINNSTIATKENGKSAELDVNHAINNMGNCDFVDLYPDRTLFSFNPKVNTIKRRIEKNWELFLTYPYENFDYHNLVRDVADVYRNGDHYEIVSGANKVNALLAMEVEYLGGDSMNLPTSTDDQGNLIYQQFRTGRPMLRFRSFCQHHIKQGDSVRIYYKLKTASPGEEFQVSSKPYVVNSVGDSDLKNKDYYFTINDDDLLDEIFGENATVINPYNYWFRFARVAGGSDCQYYIRMMKKIPNLKRASENLTVGIGKNRVLLDEYIQRNAVDSDHHMLNFDCECYPMAFGKTLYGDDVTQYTFVDSIKLDYLRDNLNRPLSEIAATVVKKNVGYKEWYETNKESFTSEEMDNIEFSHCFGKITSGIEYYGNIDDDSPQMRSFKGIMSDIHLLNNDNTDIESKPLEWWYSWWKYGDPESDDAKTEVLATDEVFFGDVVEFSPTEFQETVLADCCHRFNTAQREMEWDCDYDTETGEITPGNGSKFQFIYQELDTDDFDYDGFQVNDYGVDLPKRNEGYWHKINEIIPVRAFGKEVQQASHKTLSIVRANPIQADGIYIQVQCNLAHGASVGNRAYFCDDSTRTWYETHVVFIDGKTTLSVNVIPHDVEVYQGLPYINWIDTCTRLNNGTLKLRIENPDIPDYAVNAGVNLFMWRNFELRSHVESSTGINFPFANNHLYIERGINFYLRRQDPDGTNGLYYRNDVFPDIPGDIMPVSNYEYIPEEDNVC